MKRLTELCPAVIGALFPFLKKRDVRELKEFTDLVKDQFRFLAEQLRKFQEDYFELAGRVKQLFNEISVLNEQLRRALGEQCTVKDCMERRSNENH